MTRNGPSSRNAVLTIPASFAAAFAFALLAALACACRRCRSCCKLMMLVSVFTSAGSGLSGVKRPSGVVVVAPIALRLLLPFALGLDRFGPFLRRPRPRLPCP
jgi:hypothetical protein